MNFDFSDEQKLFQDQVRKALGANCPLAEVRRVLESDLAHSESAWKTLVDLGIPGAVIAEAHGGLGLDYYELCLAAYEVGRALAPTPLSGSVYLAAEALMLAGDDAQKALWLPGLASGETLIGFGDADLGGGLRYAAGRLDGACAPVWDARGAKAVIVRAERDGLPALFLAPLDPASTVLRPLPSVDPSRDISEIRFTGALAEPLDAYGPGDAFETLRDRAAILLAFEQLGGAERALEMARDYALQRHAFGRPIGSYQAIKHKLANVYIRIEIARAHALYGAWALSTGATDLPLAAASARVAATDAFLLAAQENIQTHGGIGYAWEADCHLFFRRARLSALQLGNVLNWKERVMSRLEHRNAA